MSKKILHFLLLLILISSCAAKRNAVKAKIAAPEPPQIQEPVFSINFYPNPVKDMLTVSFNSSAITKGIIRVYDLLGLEVQRSNMDIKEGANSVSVTMDKLAHGIYLVEAFAGSKQLGIKRITKE